MIIILLLFFFFLISGIQVLRGRFQWLIPEPKQQQQPDLKKKGEEKSARSRAVGVLFLFCAVCVLTVGLGSALKIEWLSRLVAGIMFVIVLAGLIFIGSSNKLRK